VLAKLLLSWKRNNDFWIYIRLWQQYKICLVPHIKCLIFLSDFKQTSIFSTYFNKKSPASIFEIIRSVGAECIIAHTDRQAGRVTDRYDEAISRFSLLCKRSLQVSHHSLLNLLKPKYSPKLYKDSIRTS